MGKNTEVVYHSLLQWTAFCQNSPAWPVHLGWPYMATAMETTSNSMYCCCCLVTKSCLTCNSIDYRESCSTLLATSVHRISQERILAWVAILCSRVSSQPWDWIHIPWTGRGILNLLSHQGSPPVYIPGDEYMLLLSFNQSEPWDCKQGILLRLFLVSLMVISISISEHHFNSVQFSRSVMSNALQHHGLQHARPPCPSPTPGVHSNSCPLSRWCHPTISSSVTPFSSHLQSFPASGSFQMSQLFTSGGQSIGVSASTSVLPMNSQDWYPLGWTGWTSLQSKGLSRVFSNTTVQKHQFFSTHFLYSPNLTSVHDYWKNHSLD